MSPVPVAHSTARASGYRSSPRPPQHLSGSDASVWRPTGGEARASRIRRGGASFPFCSALRSHFRATSTERDARSLGQETPMPLRRRVAPVCRLRLSPAQGASPERRGHGRSCRSRHASEWPRSWLRPGASRSTPGERQRRSARPAHPHLIGHLQQLLAASVVAHRPDRTLLLRQLEAPSRVHVEEEGAVRCPISACKPTRMAEDFNRYGPQTRPAR